MLKIKIILPVLRSPKSCPSTELRINSALRVAWIGAVGLVLLCFNLKAAEPALSMKEQIELQEAIANKLEFFAQGIDNINTVQDAKLIWNAVKDSIFASDNDIDNREAFKLLSDRIFWVLSNLVEPQSQEQVEMLKNDIINIQERLGISQKFPQVVDLTREINQEILFRNPNSFAEFRAILGNRYLQIEKKLNQLNEQARKLLLDSGLDSEGLLGILSDSKTNNASVIEMFS